MSKLTVCVAVTPKLATFVLAKLQVLLGFAKSNVPKFGSRPRNVIGTVGSASLLGGIGVALRSGAVEV